MTDTPKCRLVTRSDFDGLVCAVLLKERGLIDAIEFVHPKDMQDGKIPMGPNDISTNLPYVAGCHLAFDHHASEMQRVSERPANHIIDPNAASAARVVYDYYGGAQAFPRVSAEMMDAVDKADSAQFSLDEILNPKGWVLLSFLMDARTGLGRFREFRVSNYQLMMELIDYCRDHTIDEILALPDVAERAELYAAHHDRARAQLRRTAELYGKLVILDLRKEEPIYATNRFTLYALFPKATVSIHVIWGVKQQNTAFAIGKSIIDRSSPLNVGELCLRYGGGGHAAAGTCQIPNEDAEKVLGELMAAISATE
ncbi:MAG TPA: exopolyphosphatase [Xanthomonadaceae bacterium]|jgi:nanoRNase/pAp phosphatase (c-di-AMP/oligoRNAs hydrolase)